MLRDWFSSLPAYEHKNADNLSALIEACRQESLTGLLRLNSSRGDLYLWTFVEGEGNTLFEFSNEKWKSVPRSQWIVKLEDCRTNIRQVHVPIQGIRVCELVLTADIEQCSSMKLSGTDLLREVQVWFDRPCPGFIQVQTVDQEIFALMFGDSVSNMEVLTIKDNRAVFSVEQPDDLLIREEIEYQVRYYAGYTEQSIWLENRLRLAFAALLRMMIQRFGYMIGFALADRLNDRLSEANQARGLSIKLTSNGIENCHLFHSLEEASEAYSFILNSFFDEASILIGPRMAKGIAMNMLEKLSQTQREMLVTNLRELNGPQFGLASTPGK